MTEQQQHHPAYTWLRALYQCRELGAALSRFGTAGTLQTVKTSLPSLPCCSPVTADDVSHGAAEVAKLVLKELGTTEHSFTCSPSQEGLETLSLVQQAVFGPDSLQSSFAECVFLASLAQAARAQELVTAALLDVVAPHNCLSLLNVAAACGCAPLRRKARRLALRCFPAAAQQDCNGLLAMEEAHLLGLLCSDRLAVEGGELAVFRALAAWTEADAPARQPRLAARLARCVRLASLTLPELYVLGDHPLVVSDRPSCQLVAQVVIHMMMGVQLDYPLGLPTIARPRRHSSSTQQAGSSDAASAAAADGAADAADGPAQERDCGSEGHAHGLVFEAAACAFARQRLQQRGPAAMDSMPGSMQRKAAAEGCCSASPDTVCSPQPRAPASTARIAPGSAPALDAPTPTAAAHAAAAGAPAVQPTARVRHFGVGKRVSSRRTLFDMGGSSGGGSSGDGEPAGSSAAAAGDGDKTPPAVAGLGTDPSADAPPSDGRLLGGVTLDMGMSPNHASVRALEQLAAAAAQPLQLGSWGGRKRLRFD